MMVGLNKRYYETNSTSLDKHLFAGEGVSRTAYAVALVGKDK